MKVAVIDYGMGNIGSVRRAFVDLKAEVLVTKNPADLYSVDRIVLPGVGGFSEGMARLNEGGWTDTLRKVASLNTKAILGICLGMQMLATEGEEGQRTSGLDLISGKVLRLDKLGCDQRIPHVGWNDVELLQDNPLLRSLASGTDFYFVHSYGFAAHSRSDVSATVCYGASLTAIVQSGNIYGTQFHPEKSSKAGRQILKNFLELNAC